MDFTKAENILNRDYYLCVPLLEGLKHNEAEVFYCDKENVVIKGLKYNSYRIRSDKTEFILDFIKENPRKTIVVYGDCNFDIILNTYKNKIKTSCKQIIYTGPPLALNYNDIEIRPIDKEFTDFIFTHYTLRPDTKEEMELIVESSEMYGAFYNNKIIGFVGLHNDGSMGYLEVIEEYRRLKIGTLLEKFIINKVLAKGRTPFGHIIDDNNKCLKLQNKIENLVIAKKPVVWIVDND